MGKCVEGKTLNRFHSVEKWNPSQQEKQGMNECSGIGVIYLIYVWYVCTNLNAIVFVGETPWLWWLWVENKMLNRNQNLNKYLDIYSQFMNKHKN